MSPIIINTVITIQSALTPKAETPEELESPVPVDLWEKRGWKELKFWFLEEEGDEDTASLAPLIPQGESLQVFNCSMTQTVIWDAWPCYFTSFSCVVLIHKLNLNGCLKTDNCFIGRPSLQVSIKSICLTLEAGVGHRTIPMLLAKSSFHGDVANWSTLINIRSHLDMEVRHEQTHTLLLEAMALK